jgi:hypothetical protein
MPVVTKEELIDLDAIRALIQHFGVDNASKKILRFLQRRRRNVNVVDVHYDYAKNWRADGLGRLYPMEKEGSHSASRLSGDIRAAVTRRNYWDVDMENCQPRILHQWLMGKGMLCEAFSRYVADRDGVLAEVMAHYDCERKQAKELMLRMMFLGTAEAWMADELPEEKFEHQLPFVTQFQAEAEAAAVRMWDDDELGVVAKVKKMRSEKTDRGKRATHMSLFLQNIENKLLTEIGKSMERQGRQMDVLIFDGGLIRKLTPDEPEFPAEILRRVEADVLESTNLAIRLAIKPLVTTIDLSPQNSASSSYIRVQGINDRDAAIDFINAHGKDKIMYDRDALYIFDSRTGMFTCDKEVIKYHIMVVHAHKLRYVYNNGVTDVYVDYGRELKRVNTLIATLPCLCLDTGRIEKCIKTSLGKLLFSDGIYDFDSDTFTDGFNPKIFFTDRIERPFPRERNEEMIAKVHKILFEDPFLAPNNESANFIKKALATALYGKYRLKKFYFCVGRTNCGKGVTETAFKNSFGGYVTSFDMSHFMIGSSGSDDPAKAMGYLMPIFTKRIAFSQEATMTSAVDGNKLKSVFSGGDDMHARKLHENAGKIVNRCTGFGMCNDVPKVNPMDKAVSERVRVVEYKAEFVEEPSLPHHRQADEDVKDMFEDDDSAKDALFYIMADSYQAYEKEGLVPPPEVLMATKEYAEDQSSLRAILEERYEITGKTEAYVVVGADGVVEEFPHGDYVTTEELNAFFNEKKLGMGPKARANGMKDLGLTNMRDGNYANLKLFGTMKRVWLGLKHIE